MAESLSSIQSLNPNPAKPESDNPTSQANPQPESVPQPLPSAPTPPPTVLSHSSISNPPTVPTAPNPVPVYAPPPVTGGAPLFRPALPQFTPVPGTVNYQNPSMSSAPGMANLAAPGPAMPYQVQVPVPGQPPNPTLRPYVPVPNGYAAVPPPGLPGYSAPYTAVARPAFPPRPPGPMGVLPAVPRPPISVIPGVRPIIPPMVRPGLVSVTPAEKPQTTIYVGKIAPTADNDFMLSLLKLCGPVKSWKRVQDPTDGTLKRFGFCEFESAEGVLRALRLLNKLNIDGQELVLNLNEATKGYLLRYIEKKTENAKKEKEALAVSTADKEGEAVSGAEKTESAKPAVEELKKDESDSGKKDDSESGKRDDSESGKKEPDYSDFGLVTDEDREADKEASEKMTSMIEERLKSLPPPPPRAPADTSGITDSEAPSKSKDRDSDADLVKNDGEDRNEDEMTSDNRASSEHDKTETSSPDRSRKYDRRSRDRDRDRDRDLKREKEREIERYEREAERERIRKEREQRRKIEDAEREYEERLKDWEYREREKEKQRQYEREREKERERKRKKEIIYDEEDGEDDSRRWRNRSTLEEKRKKRQREKEDDLADRIKEGEEIAEAKKKAEEEEKQRLLQREEMKQTPDHAVNENENSAVIEGPMTERNDEGDYGGGNQNHLGEEEASQIVSGDGSITTIGVTSDMQNNSNAPAKKLGFGLSGSGKRTAVPSVFHQDDDDDIHKEKKMRPLVPIDYSNEEMEAVHPASGALQPHLAAAAEFAKQISNSSTKEEKPESERERSRRSHDRVSQREKDRRDDENKERGLYHEHGREKLRTAPDNKKLLDAKQLIDMIPKTKEDLFSYEINWALYDQHLLHERMRPWISKKITEFLGEEEKSLVDYIVSSTQEHVKATEMLDTLKSILDEEAEMFVLKMWRMLIYEIKRVETGLHLRSRA